MWLTSNLKVWLYSNPTDMRKSIDGLSIIVSEKLSQNPCGSDLFVFFNNAKNKLKILYYDKNGFCLWYKRLEKSRFLLPNLRNNISYVITVDKLRWLLDGLDLKELKGNQELFFNAYY